MLEIAIPEFGLLQLKHLVLDYNGTLSLDGKIAPAAKEKLFQLSQHLKIHILTADTFGTARAELSDVPCEVHVMVGAEQDEQKELYVNNLGALEVVAFGNGRNDRRMLNAVRLGIAVLGREGCAVETLQVADICILDVVDGLDLLLNPKRLEATLKL